MKKQKTLLVLCVLITAILFSAAITTHRKAPQNKVISDAAAFHKNSIAIAAALEQQGWNMEETALERLVPVGFQDKSGNVITFYEYRYTHIKAEEDTSLPLLYREVLDPKTAESTLECQVGNIGAYIYEKDDLSYLWWEPEVGTVLVIRYDRQRVAQNEMIQMAEGCVKTKFKEYKAAGYTVVYPAALYFAIWLLPAACAHPASPAYR